MVILFPLFSALVAFGLAWYAWRLRHRYAWVFSFALLTFLVAEWSLGYVFELGVADLGAKVLWAKVEYLGIVSVPLLWFVFAWQYVERDQWLTRRRLAWLSAIPAATFLLVWTNELHGLVWQQTTLVEVGSVTILDVVYGYWFWVHSAFSYLMLFVGSVILLQAFGRFSSAYRWQMTILLLGPLVPWISNILYITGLGPTVLDMTPLAFAVSGAIFAWGIFRLHLFDIGPVARRTLVDSMSDGMLVVDLYSRIVDVNPAFLQIVRLEQTAVIGRSLEDLLVDRPDFAQQYQSSTKHIAQTYEDLALNDRFYDISISPLLNGQQQVRGRLIVLRDITIRKQVENELFAQKQLSEIMVSVAWAATQDLDLDVVMGNVVQTAVSLTKAEVGSLILLDTSRRIIRSILASNDGEPIVQKEGDLQHILDEGLVGWVVRQREAVMVSDTTQDERWVQLPDKPNRTRSVLAVPIMERSHIMGVLTMTHTHPQHFTDQDKTFLQASANQMSLALRNAQSYENQRRLAQNQSTLYQVLRAMSGHLDRDDVLNSAADTITLLTDWTTLCILIVDETGSRFISRVTTGSLSELGDEHFDVDSGIWGRALQMVTIQFIPDIRQDLDFVGGYAPLQSALVIPMFRGDRQLGVFYLESDQPDGLNEDDRWLATSLAEAIVLAADNAQIHDSLRQYASDLSTLYSITRLVSRSLMDEDVLEQALYVALTSLRFDMGLIALTNSRGALYLVAERGLPAAVSNNLDRQGFVGTICEYVFKRQEAVYLPDLGVISKDLAELRQMMPTAVAELQQLGIQAYYGIPLQYQDKYLGTLCLFNSQPRPPASIEEQALHGAIGQQISTATINIDLYSQVNQQLKEQTALREAITAITSSLDLPTVLSQIAEQMSRALDSTSAYICSYQAHTMMSEVLAEYVSPEAIEQERPSDLGFVYDLTVEFPYQLVALAKGDSVIIHVDDPDLPDIEQTHLKEYGAKSILRIPLQIEGQTIAYAEVWESRQHRDFTEEEIQLVRLMARQAAIAMENANLFASIGVERGRLEAVIQSSRDGVIFIGMDRRVLVINETALKVFGLTGVSEDWVARPLRDALAALRERSPEVVRATVAEMKRIEKGDEPPGNGEYEVNSRIIHWLNLPVLSETTPIGRLLILRDVTEERVVEQMRDDLTHTMVHDLRNPLTSMYLSLDILDLHLGNIENPILEQVLGRARNSTGRMLTMVNAILDISRLESGRMPIESEGIALAQLIANSFRMQMPLANQKQIELVSSVPENMVVWADVGLVERVLQNLVGNALKFTPEGGNIQVIAEEREMGVDRRIYVSVQDSGEGIPGEIRERLFQKFTTGSQQQRGSGLGLAFCRMVLEAHGERIWVERSSAEGTMFMFTLPLPPE